MSVPGTYSYQAQREWLFQQTAALLKVMQQQAEMKMKAWTWEEEDPGEDLLEQQVLAFAGHRPEGDYQLQGYPA